jgi:hypothetical protein
MRKLGIFLIIIVLFGSVMAVSAQDMEFRERYAVGGEIIPFSTTPFLFNPWILAIIVAIVLVTGGAFYVGAVSTEISK